jgi:hypothetical protein
MRPNEAITASLVSKFLVAIPIRSGVVCRRMIKGGDQVIWSTYASVETPSRRSFNSPV